MAEKSDAAIIKEHQSRNGRKGGNKTLSLYGKAHFSEMANKMHAKRNKNGR